MNYREHMKKAQKIYLKRTENCMEMDEQDQTEDQQEHDVLNRGKVAEPGHTELVKSLETLEET